VAGGTNNEFFEEEMRTGFRLGILMEEDHFVDVGIDGNMILKGNVHKQIVGM
jgi:hypothetical protein